jgi:hypothetical protein
VGQTTAAGGDGAAIKKQFAAVIELDDAVAEQASALPGLVRHNRAARWSNAGHSGHRGCCWHMRSSGAEQLAGCRHERHARHAAQAVEL